MSWIKKLIKQLEANQLQSSQDKISYIVELHKKQIQNKRRSQLKRIITKFAVLKIN